MNEPDISLDLLPGLTFRNPFGIASSHLTGNIASIKALSNIKPSFITLKTTDVSYGGNGIGSRTLVELKDLSHGGTYFADGPRTLELLNLNRTIELLTFANTICIDSIIGISISAGENYKNILPIIENAGAKYIEICFKYTPRQFSKLLNDDPPAFMVSTFEFVIQDIAKALRNTTLPLIVKLPRDLPWITSHKYLQVILSLSSKRLAFILADTEKFLLYQKDNNRRLEGVIAGNILFPETVTIIQKNAARGVKPIIASGGVMNAIDAVNVIRHGATAVQLCSTLQKNGFVVYEHIIEDFKSQLKKLDIHNLAQLINNKNQRGQSIEHVS